MKKLSVLLLTIVLHASLFAQVFEPVKWNFEVQDLGDGIYELQMKASIEDHWHLYSQHLEAGGPAPTYFHFEPHDAYTLVGKVTEGEPSLEEYEGMLLKYFDTEALFTQKVRVTAPVSVEGYVEFMACDDGQCLPPTEVDFQFAVGAGSLSAPGAVEKEEASLSAEEEDSSDVSGTRSLWKIILEAIAWGFAALLTPCVFPMIPMTISFFMKGGENKIKSRLNASTFGVSIILLYTLPIAVIILITYLLGGDSVTADIFNWLATHWIPNILFFLIFMIFAASFFGAFEITLPSWMVNKSDAKADRGGIVGAFFMALTLVLVSFSCTGPIVGSVIVKSAQGEIWEPIVTMLAFSAAFALPFTLFAFFPSWLNNLPKSGGWLNSVKVVLGFIEVALGFKFLSVADQVYHWGLLDREIYLAIWIVTFSLLGFYLLGKLKFKHDSDVPFVSTGRLALSILVFSFVVYMIPGMFGAPLKGLSGYMPPLSTHDFNLRDVVRQEVKLTAGTMVDRSRAMEDSYSDGCESPKYRDFLHLPHGLEGYFDYAQGLACAKAQNKPVFIDFTGHGCVNCREMEASVWSDPRVLKLLREEFVVTALYVDDKTKLSKDEWVTSSYDGKVKKTIGKKYADFQISRFNTNAQPYYCLLDHEGELLLDPRAYDLDVDGFYEFLKAGIAAFKKRQEE
ncbi:MAG: thiol:disulfide interchange protein [Bacteroidetes bacterium]|nr:MAG: thiol:disulfide interchange protein [Bacteroidota bacterium]PIE88401.1 MAG: thiol:disulfide interchange protein [Bacteroidota bacterium]